MPGATECARRRGSLIIAHDASIARLPKLLHGRVNHVLLVRVHVGRKVGIGEKRRIDRCGADHGGIVPSCTLSRTYSGIHGVVAQIAGAKLLEKVLSLQLRRREIRYTFAREGLEWCVRDARCAIVV